jgi:DNA glycosylase AlkZ-like
VAVTERLLAIQAQDERGARLAIRARRPGLSGADVDGALSNRRSLVVTWLNLGTLHLVRSEDYPWLHALSAPRLRTGNARRLSQEGVSPDAAERGVRVIERALEREGPLDRRRLRDSVASAGIRTRGQAFVHLLALASTRGLIVRGPVAGGQHAFVLVRDWLGSFASVEHDRALGKIARRYLAGHGPADDRDLARWSGLPLRDARIGLSAIASELRERDDGLLDLRRRPAAAPLPQPRLLGAFEPVLLGWRTRAALLGRHEPRVVKGGLFRPFALIRGRAAATWSLSGRGVAVEPFTQLTGAERAALEADAEEVESFLDG